MSVVIDEMNLTQDDGDSRSSQQETPVSGGQSRISPRLVNIIEQQQQERALRTWAH